ncbi:hypothetical protein EJ08DRAFT_738825 [Tothia fuscella]|uniref:Uncharacterized protein n=1 Tax=Tothia fuscella TaxID=1048955 RepID=A0A9P4NFR8_9PEZI|nr:hypothetical protein EJ08DRAFT_738825 [Tothia fuscella]
MLSMTNQPLELMHAQDIKIATYDNVRQSYPKEELPDYLEGESREEWWNPHYEKNRGLLH